MQQSAKLGEISAMLCETIETEQDYEKQAKSKQNSAKLGETTQNQAKNYKEIKKKKFLKIFENFSKKKNFFEKFFFNAKKP